MKKIFGVIAVMLVLVLCSTVVFAGTAEITVQGNDTNVLLGVGFEEDGKYQRTVEFREGSELRGSEVDAFQEAFFEIKEQLPEKSYFEIARFPEAPKYFVKFSDGHVYVAIGSGSSVQAAFDDLVVKFSKRQ